MPKGRATWFGARRTGGSLVLDDRGAHGSRAACRLGQSEPEPAPRAWRQGRCFSAAQPLSSAGDQSKRPGRRPFHVPGAFAASGWTVPSGRALHRLHHHPTENR
jgi:hypothetical protein